MEKYKCGINKYKEKKHNKFYVVRRKAYVHIQRLEDNFTNNEILQKWKSSKKPNTQYTQIPLTPKEFFYQTHLEISQNLDALTNEELPSIYREKWGALLHQP